MKMGWQSFLSLNVFEEASEFLSLLARDVSLNEALPLPAAGTEATELLLLGCHCSTESANKNLISFNLPFVGGEKEKRKGRKTLYNTIPKLMFHKEGQGWGNTLVFIMVKGIMEADRYITNLWVARHYPS